MGGKKIPENSLPYWSSLVFISFPNSPAVVYFSDSSDRCLCVFIGISGSYRRVYSYSVTARTGIKPFIFLLLVRSYIHSCFAFVHLFVSLLCVMYLSAFEF